MNFATLRMLATNEMTMAKSREDRHWGAAWAYAEIARRMGNEPQKGEMAALIYSMAEERGI